MRLFSKAIKLAMRSKRRYIVFTATYTVLMIWTCISLQDMFDEIPNYAQTLVALFASMFLSILYAWIIVNYRRTEIATLKCVGYTNSNVRTLIVGEIVWTTLSGFFITLEILIHYIAVNVLGWFIGPARPLGSVDPMDSPITLLNLLITLAIFLLVQVVGMLLAYHRVLKVRPMMALRIMK
ncbi:MAG: hypothetical protein RBG13Loki_0242 [Promethearchaeota archaeon CR_4]|nr:MAG: hypothetical protein RBG13Loki_0242 [Candidatus Lokiarchaeota archaeon CR_4]